MIVVASVFTAVKIMNKSDSIKDSTSQNTSKEVTDPPSTDHMISQSVSKDEVIDAYFDLMSKLNSDGSIYISRCYDINNDGICELITYLDTIDRIAPNSIDVYTYYNGAANKLYSYYPQDKSFYPWACGAEKGQDGFYIAFCNEDNADVTVTKLELNGLDIKESEYPTDFKMKLGTSFPSVVVIDGIDTDIFPIYGTDRQSLSICIKEGNDAYTEFFAQNNILD